MAGAATAWLGLGCDYEAALVLASSGDESLLRDALPTLQRLGARPAATLIARRLSDCGVGAFHGARGRRPERTPRC